MYRSTQDYARGLVEDVHASEYVWNLFHNQLSTSATGPWGTPMSRQLGETTSITNFNDGSSGEQKYRLWELRRRFFYPCVKVDISRRSRIPMTNTHVSNKAVS